MAIALRLKPQAMSKLPQGVLLGRTEELKVESLEPVMETGLSGSPFEVDGDLLEKLFSAGLSLGHANDQSDGYKLDRWLAPRLHSALRISRRLAWDRHFWAWVSIRFATRYVYERWGENGVVTPWRFLGESLRNAVSRLWWAAELLRDGPDYTMVDKGLRRVRLAQFALELKYSWYRPAAIAFVNVAEDPTLGLGDDDMKALSKRANAYLPLAPLEAIGLDETDGSMDLAWWSGSATLADLTATTPPAGPTDGQAKPEAIAAIGDWYRLVLAEVRTTPSAISERTPRRNVRAQAPTSESSDDGPRSAV